MCQLTLGILVNKNRDYDHTWKQTTCTCGGIIKMNCVKYITTYFMNLYWNCIGYKKPQKSLVLQVILKAV